MVTPLQTPITVKEGESILLKATVSKPDVPATWFKNDLEILPQVDKHYEVKVEGKEHTLLIKEATLKDAGEFALELGPVSSTSVVNVTGQRSFIGRLLCN